MLNYVIPINFTMLFLPEYFKTESDIIDYNYIVFYISNCNISFRIKIFKKRVIYIKCLLHLVGG